MPSTAPAIGLEHLVEDAEAHRAHERAEQAADAAEHHDEEAVDDVDRSEIRADIADLARARPRPCRRCRSQGRRSGHRRARWGCPCTAAMRAVLRHRAHVQPEARALQQVARGRRATTKQKIRMTRRFQVTTTPPTSSTPPVIQAGLDDFLVGRAEDRCERAAAGRGSRPRWRAASRAAGRRGSG